MADIRINALATTAASTASDDFLAVDGSSQGTRKLNAYSPTFGGNLTVSGTGNSSVAGNLGIGTTSPSGFLANKLVIATGGSSNEGLTIYTSDNTRNTSLWFADSTTGSGLYAGGIDYQHATNEMVFYTNSQGNVRITSGGNLTVSGTGNSSVAGNLGIGETSPVVPLHVKTTGTGTGDFDNAIATFRSTAAGRTITLQFSDTANQAYISSKSGALNFGVGGAVLGMSLSSSGNLLIGTAIDTGQKLQVNGEIYCKSDTGTNITVNDPTYSHPVIVLQEAGSTKGAIETNSGTLYLSTTTAGKSLILRSGAYGTALTLDSSQRCILSGALRLANTYVATPQVSTGYVTIQDSTGTTYKVLVAT